MRFLEKAASFLDRAPDLWQENVELIELNRRFLWFVVLRFGVIAILVFLGLSKKIIIPHLSVSVAGIFVIAAILFMLNIFYWFHYQWAITYHEFPVYTKMVAGNIHVQIILDFLILGYIVYECGGIESPLIYFFLFHNTLSCLFFKRYISFLHTMLSITIIITIFALTGLEVIPQKHFIDPSFAAVTFVPPRFGVYYLAGVVSIYVIAWYLVSAITDSLKLRERQFQEKIHEMIEVDREKTRYMLVTTHELKAPFAAIQSYVNVALDGYAGELSDKLREILWKIQVRCNTLVQMITDMIQLANITSLKERRQEVVTSRVDLSEIIINILPRFKETAAKKKVFFETNDLSFRHNFIEANAEQIQILLNNIIGNAVSYCYPDTKIKVEVHGGESSVVATVEDKGIGVKKEHLEKVFLEHFRSEKAVDVNPNSTGLGLTIARQIMDIHGGRIWIDSREGVGTKVSMEFPKPSE